MSNIDTILASPCASGVTAAASVARRYDGGGFNDWFLPSKDELNLIYNNLKRYLPPLGGFSDNFWSSSATGPDFAWDVFIGNGDPTVVRRDFNRPVSAVWAF